MSGRPSPRDKLLDRDAAAERFGRPRAGTLVFTNGCFDVLHRGHVEYLDRARRLGDALLVGVNSDASVRRLKGENRPFVAERDRAIVLGGLAAVDAVVLFDEDTPRDLIVALSPDILVKGGDYRPEEIVGHQEVRAAGGRVEVIPFLEGYSTSKIIARIREG